MEKYLKSHARMSSLPTKVTKRRERGEEEEEEVDDDDEEEKDFSLSTRTTTMMMMKKEKDFRSNDVMVVDSWDLTWAVSLISL